MELTPWSQGGVADSFLARRNPVVKLAVLTVISVVSLFLDDPYPAALLWFWLLAGVAWAGRISASVLLGAQAGFGGFALGTLVVQVVTRPDDPNALPLGIALALRTMVIGTASIGFLASTGAVELVSSLAQNARLPARVCYALLAGYRMLEELPREWSLLAAAHAVRDPRPRRPGPRAICRRAFTLLVISIRKGERLAHSLDLRGADRQPRTVWRPIRVAASDWIFGCSVVVAALATMAATPLFLP
jgi:energy-coupling factor transporter transmembrane protein EcfT